MEVTTQVIIEPSPVAYGAIAVQFDSANSTITARCPRELQAAQFPLNDLSVPSMPGTLGAATPHGPALHAKFGTAIATRFVEAKQNAFVYTYGQRNTSKRVTLFGTPANPETGLAFAVLRDVVSRPVPAGQIIQVSCYGVESSENLTDFLDLTNKEGILIDSVKEGPRVTKIERRRVASVADATRLAQIIAGNVDEYFRQMYQPPTDPSAPALNLPPYWPETVVLVVQRYESQDMLESSQEANSLHFVALADSDRPVLCGIDQQQQNSFEKSQKILNGVIGVLSAIRCSRLRIPFGKSKVTTMFKRGYNGEKNYLYNDVNAPTVSYFVAHVLSDEGSIEEAMHTLSAVRKLQAVIGTTSSLLTRDMALEKWRLEQDVVELKDELAIAKAVYDYRPCIFEQAKPVVNVQEEEQKRIQAIVKRREEAKERAVAEVKARAQEEAKRQIAEIERSTSRTLSDLERAVAEKRAENAQLQSERAKKMKEYERHLEKLRKKKDEEEAALEKLRQEIVAIEQEVVSKEEVIAAKRKQLDIASQDLTRSHELIEKERAETRKKREAVMEQRKRQRAQWLEEIRATNERLLAQVKQLSQMRMEKLQSGKAATAAAGSSAAAVPEGLLEDAETEEAVRADINSINEYIPKLISLDDTPADPDATESIRRQLEEYFEEEKREYLRKLEADKMRLASLEGAVQQYRVRVQEFQSKQKKELLSEAMKKEVHLQTLVDQVLQYLQHGVRMTKISSNGNVRRRFFFLSEDSKKLQACDMVEGAAINRKKPATTIILKEVKRVLLGMHGPSVASFVSSAQTTFAKQRADALRDNGTYSEHPTPVLTPQVIGKFAYRGFVLELDSGKTVELVAETDSDWEAWIVALKRIFLIRTPFEVQQDRLNGKSSPNATSEMAWGAPYYSADLLSRPGYDQLHVAERAFCSENHVPPELFLKTKADAAQKALNSLVTIYDIRVLSSLDLFRSQALFEFLIEQKIIAPPQVAVQSHASTVLPLTAEDRERQAAQERLQGIAASDRAAVGPPVTSAPPSRP